MNPIEFLQVRLTEEADALLAESARLGSRVFGKSSHGEKALAWVQRKSLLDAYVMYPQGFPGALRSLLMPYIAHEDFDQTWLRS